jgi:serine/threonine protein kinase
MALTKGDVLDGRYVIEERIGAGGYGTVYRALDRKTKRPVAIKVLRSDLADDPDYQRRFRREADIARMMKSEHVVKVLDTGQAQVRNEDAHFQVMEFVEGETLQERLKRGRLPIRKALLVAAQLAEALEEAEEKGIVHRDIKPKNIFTAKNDFALLGDFGVARATDYPSLRSDDPILGTPRYMSPEQCVGIVDATDVRSDIYSLGIVLYEMIGGKPPFEGDSPNVITYKHVNEKPKPLREVVKNLPKEADALLQRCLEKRPEDRFQHAAELRTAIWSVLEANTSNEDTPLTPTGMPARATRRRSFIPRALRVRRTRFSWAVAAGSALIVIFALGAAAWAATRTGGSESVKTTEIGVPATPVPPAYQMAFVDPAGDLIVSDASGSSEKQLTFGIKIGHPAWSKDGSKVVFVEHLSSQGIASDQLKAVDVATGQQRGISVERASASPSVGIKAPHVIDSSSVLYAQWTPRDSTPSPTLGPGPPQHQLAWTVLAEGGLPADLASRYPDLFTPTRGDSRFWPRFWPDASVQRDATDPGEVFTFDVSPKDGSLVYQSCSDLQTLTCSLRQQPPAPLVQPSAGSYWELPWDSNQVLVEAAQGYTYWSPAFSPDGTMLAYYGVQEGIAQIYLTDLSKGTSRALSPTDAAFDPNGFWPTVAWSEGGDRVYYQNAESIWSITVNGENAKPERYSAGGELAIRPTGVAANLGVPGPSAARAMDAGLLAQPGFTVAKVEYGDISGDSAEEIVVLSSAHRPGADAFDLEAFTFSNGKWMRIFDGNNWPSADHAVIPAAPPPPFEHRIGFDITFQFVDLDLDKQPELVVAVNAEPGNYAIGSLWVLGFEGQTPLLKFGHIPDSGDFTGSISVLNRMDGYLTLTAGRWKGDAHCCPSGSLHELIGFDKEAGSVKVIQHEVTLGGALNGSAAYDTILALVSATDVPAALESVSAGSVTVRHHSFGATTLTPAQLRQVGTSLDPYPVHVTCRGAIAPLSPQEADQVAYLVLDSLTPMLYRLFGATRADYGDYQIPSVLEFRPAEDGRWLLRSITADTATAAPAASLQRFEGCPVEGIDYPK